MGYPTPQIECPKCENILTPSKRVRVKFREIRVGKPDFKILERGYRCDRCSSKVWHEIAAKGIPQC